MREQEYFLLTGIEYRFLYGTNTAAEQLSLKYTCALTNCRMEMEIFALNIVIYLY